MQEAVAVAIADADTLSGLVVENHKQQNGAKRVQNRQPGSFRGLRSFQTENALSNQIPTVSIFRPIIVKSSKFIIMVRAIIMVYGGTKKKKQKFLLYGLKACAVGVVFEMEIYATRYNLGQYMCHLRPWACWLLSGF